MDFYLLKSILSAGKKPLRLTKASASFFIVDKRTRSYIEPTFQKVIFDTEKPTIVLVSAVGATGKTALAEQLSHDLKLPLLDLAKHKPVGDNTMTGLLTHAFDVKDISAVFGGLALGEYAVIIDGVDEGRSKTTEKAFEAFLDDIANLCKTGCPTTFVMLGRTKILDDCWDYLSSKGLSTALITISPFAVSQAKKYIDTFTMGAIGAYANHYESARDRILEKLAKAFTGGTSDRTDDFLSFIGYPPVLDAIVTLLREEKNYYKLLADLEPQDGQNLEVSLLKRISEYILLRERDTKVIPNIITPLLEPAPEPLRRRALESAFATEEQCVRLIAYCLDKQLMLKSLGDPVLDEKYEAGLASFFPDHPFLSGQQFRSAVFEALALATLIASRSSEALDLLKEYLWSHKHSYHLVYMLDVISKDHRIPIGALGPIFTAAMEFRSVHSVVELRVDGPDWDRDVQQDRIGEIEIGIEITLGEEQSPARTFEFLADIEQDSQLVLGPRLGDAFISVPCSVQLGGADELELMAPVDITARTIVLEGKSLILRTHHHGKESQGEVILDALQLESRVEAIMTNGVPLLIALGSLSGVSYPAIQYTKQTARPSGDPLFAQKYFRLKRILMEFRSHSKGALARYKHKIEHERVLKNDTGRAVLSRLVSDGVLVLRGSFYYLQPEQLSSNVGVSYEDLRKGRIPESLEKYIRSIP